MPATTSTSSPSGRSSRSGRPKAVVVLKLSPKLLSGFSDSKGKKSSGSPKVKEKEPSPASSSPDPAARPSSVDNVSDSASTPANGSAATDQNGRKGTQAKSGSKRTFNQAGDTLSRSRGRSGPRKKAKVEDGTVEPKAAAASHRLGPKANTGAINAGLRALDRSGTPCRRWERKPLQLRSFTGVLWQLPSWRAPVHKVEENGDAETGDSDSKANNSVSGVSGDGDFTPLPQRVVDSPSTAIAMTA